MRNNIQSKIDAGYTYDEQKLGTQALVFFPEVVRAGILPKLKVFKGISKPV